MRVVQKMVGPHRRELQPWCAVLAIEMPVRSPQEGLKALNPAFAYQSYWKALYPKPLNPNPYLSQ